jgi:hypothetical protein
VLREVRLVTIIADEAAPEVPSTPS